MTAEVDDATESDGNVQRTGWPRGYWDRWERIVGPHYALLITRVRVRYVMALCIFVAWCGIWLIVQYLVPGGSRIVSHFEPLVLIMGLILLLALTIQGLSTTRAAQTLQNDLRSAGVPVRTFPRIASIRQFEAWREKENVLTEQLTTIGRSRQQPA